MANTAGSLGPARAAGSTRLGTWPLVRPLQGLVATVLLLAAAFVLVRVHHFALTRFFTIDEYQWGHATWLVSEGKVPYRDFYEHHLPLGYLLHSLFLSDSASFTQRALTLREIAFAYIALASLAVGWAAHVAHRDLLKALLCATLPISVGFGLMSAVDYRGDNWSAFSLICCFSLLEANRTLGRRWLCALAGLVFSVAVLMTQKTILLGGLAIVVMLVLSFWRRLAPSRAVWLSRWSAQQMSHPLTFCVAAALPALALLAAGAWLGLLERAFEINVTQALQHEALYPGFSVAGYVYPYLRYAPWTSALVAGFAACYLVRGYRGFWTLPTVSALLGGLKITAPFPYNYVLASYLIGLCAVRGYCATLRWAVHRWPALAGRSVPLYLLPLAIVPSQLGFATSSTSNEDQLETLRQIELYSKPSDVVIDSEGGALFRPHRSYYWYQGRAHVKMFDDYFRGPFVDDLRASQALFWINSFRTKELPDAAQLFLRSHYVRFRGDLFVLGVALPRGPAEGGSQVAFDVVRAGDYYVDPAPTAGTGAGGVLEQAGTPLLIDGQPVTESSVRLEPGAHRAWLGERAPAFRLSYLPPAVFDTAREVGRHAPLFEYDAPR